MKACKYLIIILLLSISANIYLLWSGKEIPSDYDQIKNKALRERQRNDSIIQSYDVRIIELKASNDAYKKENDSLNQVKNGNDQKTAITVDFIRKSPIDTVIRIAAGQRPPVGY